MWERASASQIQTWNLCNLRWYFDKVLGLEDRTGSAATELGTEVHACIEDYLNNVQPDLKHALLEHNTFVKSVKDRVDASQIEIRVESEFLDTSFPVPVLGYIDLVLIDRAAKTIHVIDHKTSKNFKYAKSYEALATDTQALLYIYQAYKEFGREYTYTFGHHVICTSEVVPERLTMCSFSHDAIEAGYATLQYQVRSMKQDSAAMGIQYVDKNTAGCYKFPPKGCPHKPYCKGGMPVPRLSNTNPVPPTTTPDQGPKPVEYTIKPQNVFLDAAPRTATELTPWEVFIAPIAAKYLEEFKEHYTMTDFNKGAKIMAAKAWDLHKDKLPNNLILRSSDPAALLFATLVAGDPRYLLIQGLR